LPSEVARANYNKKDMKAFALLCEHLTNARHVLFESLWL
jgi:hypothetical protein